MLETIFSNIKYLTVLIFTTLLSDGNYSFDYYPETLSLFGKDYKEAKSISPICEQHRNLVGDNCANPECKLKEFKPYHRSNIN